MAIVLFISLRVSSGRFLDAVCKMYHSLVLVVLVPSIITDHLMVHTPDIFWVRRC